MQCGGPTATGRRLCADFSAGMGQAGKSPRPQSSRYARDFLASVAELHRIAATLLTEARVILLSDDPAATPKLLKSQGFRQRQVNPLGLPFAPALGRGPRAIF